MSIFSSFFFLLFLLLVCLLHKPLFFSREWQNAKSNKAGSFFHFFLSDFFKYPTGKQPNRSVVATAEHPSHHKIIFNASHTQ